MTPRRSLISCFLILALVGIVMGLSPGKARALPLRNLELTLTQDHPLFLKVFHELASEYGFNILKPGQKLKSRSGLIRVVGGVFTQPFQPGIKTDFGMMGLAQNFQTAYIEGNFSVSGSVKGQEQLLEHLILTSMGKLSGTSDMKLTRELAVELLKNLVRRLP